jgi:hypothetical protein
VKLEPRGQTYAFDVRAGELHVGTWPSGKVYRSADGVNWVDSGRLGNELEVMGMAVYNGKLYAGTLHSAEVYRYDGDANWTLTGRLDHTPDLVCHRAWSMALFNGQLFCGVLPSGHVHALTTGASVSYDRALAPGWKHLTAVRQSDRLNLFVDGNLVGESPISNPMSLDLTNDQSLKIGFGEHDYFRGSMSDMRLYNIALNDQQIRELSNSPTEQK